MSSFSRTTTSQWPYMPADAGTFNESYLDLANRLPPPLTFESAKAVVSDLYKVLAQENRDAIRKSQGVLYRLASSSSVVRTWMRAAVLLMADNEELWWDVDIDVGSPRFGGTGQSSILQIMNEELKTAGINSERVEALLANGETLIHITESANVSAVDTQRGKTPVRSLCLFLIADLAPNERESIIMAGSRRVQ